MDDDHARSPEDDPLLGALKVGLFDDALPAIAQGAVAAGDGDDDWFARAADGTPIVDECATAAREAIGAAALSADRQLARRAPRRRRHSASTKSERGGRHLRRPGRLVGVGVLALLVVLSLAVVTGAPQTHEGGERSSRASRATTASILNNKSHAVVRQRRRIAAARRAHQRARRQLARARSRRATHRRRRLRPVAPRAQRRAAPASSMAAAPAPHVAVARPVAAPVRRRARRALRAPDPSFTPGDLPPASEAR